MNVNCDDESIQEVNNYKGPPLESNCILIHPMIRIVKNIALGEEHILLHCIETGSSNLEKLYGMGSNKWGQLGINPL